MYQRCTKRKSKIKSLFLLVLATISLPIWGGQVDENTSRKVATQTLSRSAETNKSDNNEGFVIGDDRITSALGYSQKNSFPTDDMPPNLEWWFGEYAKQIQYAIENCIEPTTEVAQQWAQYLGNNINEKEE